MAIAILAIALVPIVGSYAVTPGAQRQAAGYAQAMNIARERLEELHSLSAAGWDSLSSSSTSIQRDAQSYSVSTRVEAPRTDNLRDVWVTVRWTDPRGRTEEITLGTSIGRRP